MTTLPDELLLLSAEAPRADAAALARAAVAAVAVRRRRLASRAVLAVVAASGSILLLRQGIGSSDVAGSAGSTPSLTTVPVPADRGVEPSIPSSRHELTALVVGGVLGLLLAGIGARLRQEEERVSLVERLLAGVWGATAAGWLLSTFRLVRDMYRAGTLTTGHQEVPVLAACAASLAIAVALVLGSAGLRRLGVMAAAAVAVVETGGVVRPLADMGYWFDGGYWMAVWPQPLLAIRTAVGLIGLLWLLFAPLGRRDKNRWWAAGGAYVLLVAAISDAMPHLAGPEFSYQGELWAAVVAAVCAGLAGVALVAYLRRALHSASAVVAVAIVLAYSAPLLARSNYLADDWTWLPGSAGVVGVVLLPFVVWAWSSRRELGADE